MKLFKTFALALSIASSSFIAGCATPLPLGLVYTKVNLPGQLGSGDMHFTKEGEAKSISLFALFASGDSSLNAACRQGGITNVSWSTTKVNNILGIYGSYTTVVYGK